MSDSARAASSPWRGQWYFPARRPGLAAVQARQPKRRGGLADLQAPQPRDELSAASADFFSCNPDTYVAGKALLLRRRGMLNSERYTVTWSQGDEPCGSISLVPLMDGVRRLHTGVPKGVGALLRRNCRDHPADESQQRFDLRAAPLCSANFAFENVCSIALRSAQ